MRFCWFLVLVALLIEGCAFLSYKDRDKEVLYGEVWKKKQKKISEEIQIQEGKDLSD